MYDAEVLKASVSLLSVFPPKSKLKKQAGGEYSGLCPFHEDSTPSLSVNPEKGVYHCHGCGKEGDIFTFLEEAEGLDFKQACERLTEMAHLLPPDNPRVVAKYPYTDEHGAVLFEVRRWEPGRNGKRKDFTQHAYDPARGFADKLGDTRRVLYRLPKVMASDTVYLVEGERDVESLERYGYVATTNPGGAQQWRAEYAQYLAGKTVYVLPDNDEPGLKRGRQIMADLKGKADARLIQLPAPAKDVTDWFQAGHSDVDLLALIHGPEAIPEEILEEPGPPPPEIAEPDDEEPKGKKPNALARQILREHYFLRNSEGYIYQYNGRYWHRITSNDLTALALRYDMMGVTSMKRRNEVASYIKDSSHVDEIHWRQIALNETAFANGVLNIQTGTLRPHRREDYLETVVPHHYDANATCPQWMEALKLYFGDDEDCDAKVDALQEFFGYCLLPHARYKKALVLYGDSDTGKSQPCFVLRELLGIHNVCAVSVEDMDDSRKRVPLVGKMLNVLTELSAKSVIADGGFKTLISTEEPLQFDAKYEVPIMYSPFCKHVIACNELPGVNDRSRATFNRLILLKFNHIITTDERDRNIMDRFRKEIQGIIVWALGGAVRLVENGGEFTSVKESETSVREYREQENDMYLFVEERCIRDEESAIPNSDFRSKFFDWTRRTLSPRAVSLMAKAAGLKILQNRSGRIGRWVWGVRWKDSLDV